MTEKEAVRTVLAKRGMTQTQLAHAMGYTHQSGVSQVLARANGMRTDVLIKLFNAMGYEVVLRDKYSKEEILLDNVSDSESK